MMSTRVKALHEAIHREAGTHYILGNEELIDFLLVAWLSRGHVLIEGPPGTGKTLSAKVLSRLLARSFKRIQFTSDMLPADITGSHVYQPGSQSFQFIKGPIFADCILADEINRTPPRTQSALLEAMEERQVTIEGHRFELVNDFFVIATQNPQDFEGTFPLPEAQTDRFLFKLVLGHATPAVDVRIMRGALEGTLPPDFEKLPSIGIERAELDAEVESIRVDDSILQYVSRVLTMTRNHPQLLIGASVRGGLAIAKAARVLAALAGRDFVIPDDVKKLALPVLRHRIHVSPEAQMGGETPEKILGEILKKAEFPT
jgi:MoxR-like ATPase